MSTYYGMAPALALVTASTELAVSREDVKIWLKLEEPEILDDSLIDGLIATATAKREAFTNVAALKQTYDYIYDSSPYGCAITLPRSPLVSVTSIKGYASTEATDTGGTAMSTGDYYVDTAHEPGRVVPLGVSSYPSATRIANAFMVRFVAGYSSGTSGVPESIKTDLKNMIASAYEHRGDEAEMQNAMERVLSESDLHLPEWG